ncbi:MAG: ABC transporter ATP-binding protein [Cyclobacteriaceae bacterium]
MIEIRALVKNIDTDCILQIPDLFFDSGLIHGIVGRNGSGKSTLLRIILDLDNATAGEVLIDGHNNKSEKNLKKKVGAYLDDDFLIDFLTPEEYFELIFRLKLGSLKSYADFISFMAPFFADEILGQDKQIINFSKGNRQKIGIAGALIGDPKILILDEPMAHLDPNARKELKDLLKKLCQEKGLTIVITSHDSLQELSFFDKTIALDRGTIQKI